MRPWLALALCAGLLGGCASLGQPTAVERLPADIGAPPPDIGSRPAVEPARPVPPPNLAIVVTNDTPVFSTVLRELIRQHNGGYEVYSLAGPPGNVIAVRGRLQASEAEVIIALGWEAAQLVREFDGKAVVFGQVFNYEGAGFVSPSMKGVSAIPPPNEQFRLWKKLAPKLARVGVITGPEHRTLVYEAAAAARAARIELVHVEVNSDKEMLYAYKDLAPRIQGLWLLPDNRVLSLDVLRELMAFSVKQGKQVLAFHPDLLELGALLVVENDPADVAARLLERTRIATGSTVPGAAVVPLTRTVVQVNPVVAQRFGLSVPRELAGVSGAR